MRIISPILVMHINLQKRTKQNESYMTKHQAVILSIVVIQSAESVLDERVSESERRCSKLIDCTTISRGVVFWNANDKSLHLNITLRSKFWMQISIIDFKFRLYSTR